MAQEADEYRKFVLWKWHYKRYEELLNLCEMKNIDNKGSKLFGNLYSYKFPIIWKLEVMFLMVALILFF